MPSDAIRDLPQRSEGSDTRIGGVYTWRAAKETTPEGPSNEWSGVSAETG